jgi:hypothetical protein
MAIQRGAPHRALTISTFATGASLGSTNSVPFRFWIVAFDNASTAFSA